MGIDPMNNISIIIRILFAITLFQQYEGLALAKQWLYHSKINKVIKYRY
jgi:hypothetical protein